MTATEAKKPTLPLARPVSSLFGVGPERASQLGRVDIFTVEDLLLHRPRRYEDRRHFRPIAELQLDEPAITRGTIIAQGVKWFRKRERSIFEMILDDGTARLHCRWWNLPFMEKYFQTGDEVFVYGKLKELKPRTIDHPETEVVESGEDNSIHINRIAPVYPLTEGLGPGQLRRAMEAAPRQSPEELLELYAHLIERWHGRSGGRLGAAVSCSAPQRVTPDYLQALSSLARKHDLPFNIHLLETRLQRVFGDLKYGKSLVRYVHDLGVLDEQVMAIHAIWIDERDAALLAASGCTVAHNPVCNLRLGSGVMPWQLLREAGVPVCLGSDEMNTDDTANMWFVAKTAALLQTLAGAEYRDWPAGPEMLAALTAGGARALRKAGTLGKLAPGCAADLVLLDLDTAAFTPLNDLRRQLVFCEDGSSVRTTVVAGRVVYEGGRVTTLDEKALRAEARELMQGYGPTLERTTREAQRLEPYYREMYFRAAAADVGMRRHLH